MTYQKSLLAALASLALVGQVSHAMTPITAPKANGRTTEPSCSVSAANDGAYNVGRLSGSLLKANANTPLPAISKIWSVSCDAATYLTFSTVDNRADSATVSAAGSYGLGRVNGSGKIGFYQVVMKNASVDGRQTNVFSTNGPSFSAVASVPLTTTNRAYGWASANSVQKSGLTFAMELEVKPTLASTTTMNGPITDNTHIDGSMSLNFAFGI